MKTNIINDSEVPGLFVVIQVHSFFDTGREVVNSNQAVVKLVDNNDAMFKTFDGHI